MPSEPVAGKTPLREVMEPHEGRVVMVRHKDGNVRLWWKNHDRWHSNRYWFGWTWGEVVEDATLVRLSPHQSEWEEI